MGLISPNLIIVFVEYYPRKIDEKLEKWMRRREVLLIRGPRQSGKTTCLLHLRDMHGGSYVTLEDADALRTFDESPKEFASRYLDRGGILYLDEVQYSKNAGKNLKLIYDTYGDSLKLVVTGSGSFDVKVQVGGYLVGRAAYFELLPLSFGEFLLWRSPDLSKLFETWRREVKGFISGSGRIESSPAFQNEFRALLEEFVVYGGFPAIVKENDPEFKRELLSNLVRTYLERDVFFFFNIREMEKFRSLLTYLSLSAGSMLQVSSVISDLRMDFRTVENYLSVLSNTYVTMLIPPYHTNPVTELKKTRKLYFVDTGLRNALLENYLPLQNRTDGGVLLENFVLNELRDMGFSPKYWRTTSKAEVDFIIEVDGNPVPIEVKSRGKEQRGFYRFVESYSPKTALVFTEGDFGVKSAGKTKILYLPHYFV
ncbi:hypothetical protein B9Q04_12650 [Candidatus Marsarchaeota G2 archaeon BE_D]|uniref:AAA+ ATPase domain-containing protein n=4 Tax=Candidatus Marsarchaeota group 2 TaxID=2203771 RepID=A0A2R6C896_9ARCH|nr:MAG: hypothetical protein B9Q06_06225 [Candidatus Marsarchaeota G2 archaeon ECH_B_2]PSN99933.1 MAG: hypothetical protein B9Q07_05200 [Candidatus Marsarchaeota G2 archaeon ECH_B_3]PSO02151.1 MAG: hypothetical protein B9Q05_06325 [Candidatus Marsarchaeota G2 archaeon ECH_B_1]PSO07101.1 MAG: hypothetical protein B9Q04_12650 [Candidatus Marsarchaeota G2 archaeon BE_D]